jgi:hypothetical protein
MSLAFKSWVMNKQEKEENNMNDVQNFIDELKNVRKLIEDPKPKITKFDDAINMIENIIGKYQAIIDENERDNNEHNG